LRLALAERGGDDAFDRRRVPTLAP